LVEEHIPLPMVFRNPSQSSPRDRKTLARSTWMMLLKYSRLPHSGWVGQINCNVLVFALGVFWEAQFGDRGVADGNLQRLITGALGVVKKRRSTRWRSPPAPDNLMISKQQMRLGVETRIPILLILHL
jgi:hypothetical protein